MSPTKRSTVVRSVSSTKFRVALAAAAILAIVWPASAGQIYWTGGTDLYWSQLGNWTSPIPSQTFGPALNESFFDNRGAAAGAATVTSIVNQDDSAYTLTFANSGTNYQSVQIDAGKSLTIYGSRSLAPASGGLPGSYQFYTGMAGVDAGKDTVTRASITGGGTLVLRSGSSRFVVRQTSNVEGDHNAILDLSGLDTLSTVNPGAPYTTANNINGIFVGTTEAAGVNNNPAGILYLAKNNNLVINSGNAFTVFQIGRSTTGTGASGVIYLGQTNNFNMNYICAGGQGGTGFLGFNPAFLASGPTPTMVWRGRNNGTTAQTGVLQPTFADNILIGDDQGAANGVYPAAVGVVDLRGGIVDIRVNSLTLGRTQSFGGTTPDNFAPAEGYFSFNAGTVIVGKELILSQMRQNVNSIATLDINQYVRTELNVAGTAELNVMALANNQFRMNTFSGGTTAGVPMNGWAETTVNISDSAVVTSTPAIVGNLQLSRGNSFSQMLAPTAATSFGRGLNATINMNGGTLNAIGLSAGGATSGPNGTAFYVGAGIFKDTYQNTDTGLSVMSINMTNGAVINLNTATANIGLGTTYAIDNVTFRGNSQINNLRNLYVKNLYAGQGTIVPTETLTLSDGGKIDMRDGSVNTLTVGADGGNSTLFLAGVANFYAEMPTSGSTADVVNVVNTVSSVSDLNFLIGPTAGSNFDAGTNTYTVMRFGTWSAGTSLNVAPALGFRSTIDSIVRNGDINGTVDVTVTKVDAKNLTWAVGYSDYWGLTGSNVWNDGISSEYYYDLDTVKFDDTAAGDVSVLVQGNVTPGAITVSNNAYNFTFTPDTNLGGKITGVINGLTKAGTGTLGIDIMNDYKGATTIANGTVVLGDNSIIPDSTILAIKTSGGLGDTSVGTAITGGTLDINGFSLGNENITVQGSGMSNVGAIVNNGTNAALNALKNVTLTGDASIGGSANWAINGSKADPGATGATLNGAYNLTKTGANTISLVAVDVDDNLGSVNVNQGVLSLEGSTNGLGDPTKTVTIASSATLQMEKMANPLNKKVAINGGTLKASKSNSGEQNQVGNGTAGSGDIAVGAYGATLDAVSGANMMLNGAISGSTTINKNGGGVVILNGTSPFSGLTRLNDGNLVVNGSLAGSLTMTSSTGIGSTKLSGNGTIGGTVTDVSNGIISPGNSAGTINFGNLSLGSAGVGYLYYDLSSAPVNGPNDLISVSSNLALAGFTNVSVNWTNDIRKSGGTYTLIKYGTKSAGGIANLSADPESLPTDSRVQFAFTNPANEIDLVVAGETMGLKWVGTGSNTWDIASPTNLNWKTDPGAVADTFYTFDSVTFDDTGSTGNVSMPYRVRPSTVTLSNNTLNYTISGSGQISGFSTLIKAGTGSATLSNILANDYSGGTLISGGTLRIGTGGSGSGIGSGDLSFENNSTIVFDNQQDYVVSGIISGTGNIIKNNSYGSPTTLTLQNSNTFGGTNALGSGGQVIINGGKLVVGSNTALGATEGTTSGSALTATYFTYGTKIASGATLDINGYNLGGEYITVGGSGIGGNGAIINSRANQQNALQNVFLTGNTTFGTAFRMDIRGGGDSGPEGVNSYNGVAGNGYNITKKGSGQMFIVDKGNTNLGGITIEQGEFGVQGTTNLGTTAAAIASTINVASGAQLTLFALPASNIINKQLTLNPGATFGTTNGAGMLNTFNGNITLVPGGTGVTFYNYQNSALTINNSIVGTGPIHKTGPGVLTLNGANTYVGASPSTYLDDGTLIVNGSITGELVMATGTLTSFQTTLTGTGTIAGPVTNAASSVIAPGINTNGGMIGSLWFGNGTGTGLTLVNNGRVNYDLSSTWNGANDLLNVNGDLSIGTTTIGIGPYQSLLNPGTYRLINYSGNLVAGSAANLSGTLSSESTRQTFNFDTSTANQVNYIVTGSANDITWVGDLSNSWDLITTANFLNQGSADMFYNLDRVRFDDTSTSNVVALAQVIQPSVITVSNDTKNYTFNGTGLISGAGALTKQGTGTLTVTTTNNYLGQTIIESGTVIINGTLGNNTRVTITGGTVIAGQGAALGNSTSVGTTINGGTLDVNGMNMRSEWVTVQGTGVDGKGAIRNNGAQQISALQNVTISNDVTFGGADLPAWGTGETGIGWGRWDVRADSVFTTNGGSYNITKVSPNQIAFVAASVPNAVGASLANIYVDQGHIAFQTSTNTMGDPTKTVYVNGGTDYTETSEALAARASLNFYNCTNILEKQVVLNGGTIWAESADSSTQNQFRGKITLTDLGGVIDVGGNLMKGTKQGDNEHFTVLGEITGTGGLRKHEDGTLIISGLTTYAGDTHINAGEVLINTPIVDGTPELNNVTSGDDLGISNLDNSVLIVGTDTVASSVGVKSIHVSTLRINAGSKVTINANPSGPTAGIVGGLAPVPEPSTWAMLVMAAMGLGMYWRRRR